MRWGPDHRTVSLELRGGTLASDSRPPSLRWGSSNDQAKGKEGTAGKCSLLWG